MTIDALGGRLAEVHEVLFLLRDALTTFPELRVCQLIVNVTKSDPYYVSDKDLAMALKKFLVEWEGR